MFSESPIRPTRRRQISDNEPNITTRRQNRSNVSMDDLFNASPIRTSRNMDSFSLNSSDENVNNANITTRRRRISDVYSDEDSLFNDLSMLNLSNESDIGNVENVSAAQSQEDRHLTLAQNEAQEDDDYVPMTEEEIYAENARILDAMKAAAHFPMEEYDTEDKHVLLPITNIKLTGADEKDVYDFMNISHANIDEFLKEDPDNIVLKFGSQKQLHGTTREDLANAVKTPFQISYACSRIVPKAEPIRLADVNTRDIYFQLRGVGFPSGVVSIHDIGAILRDDMYRVYHFVPTKKVLKTTVSYAAFHYNLVGSNVCDEDNEMVVYETRIARPVSGGNKKTNKKSQKIQKKTNKTKTYKTKTYTKTHKTKTTKKATKSTKKTH